MKKRILIAVIAVIFVAAIACTLYFTLREGSEGILYRVTGDRAEAYLLGSIHIGTSAMHPFGDTLRNAMTASDTFVFECDTTSEDSLAQLRLRQTLPEDTALSGILGDSLYGDVAAAYKALNLSTASLETRQPWAVINTLAVYSSAAEMGVSNVRNAVSLGVETAVREYANSHGKPFAYLETVDEVADTMEGFSDELTRYLIQSETDVVLGKQRSADVETVSQWPAWWRDGDVASFQDFYNLSFHTSDEALYTEYQDKLVVRRNALMAERLDSLLKDGGRYFVTIGLLHLIPEDDSLLSLLRDMGYTVEKVETP